MKRAIVLFSLVCLWAFAWAQETLTVRGKIKDADNKPMPGASITEKGTTNTVIADVEGVYQIKAKSTAVLVFSYLGYKTAEQRLDGRTVIDVTLQDDQNNLNEVVVLGYGQTTTRKDLTGAIASIKGAELSKIPVPNIGQALQGRLAGVQVTQPSGDPGSTPQIKIRGGSSITQSNEPLYVVDGVPQTDGLAFLDPMDVESVDILKDASSTALYGARGANGVVLITTKQSKGGKTSISYDGYVGIQNAPKFLPVMGSRDYLEYIYENSTRDAARAAKFVEQFGPYASLSANYGNRPGINWQEEIFGGTASSQYHKVSINGGSGDTRYNVFYSRNINDGLMLKSGANKDIAKLTVTNTPNKKLRLSGLVNYSNQKIYGSGGTQEGGNARLSMLQTLLQYRPVNALNYNEEDLLNSSADFLDPSPSSPAFQSPIVTVNTRHIEQRIRSLNANITARYGITDKLSYNGLASFVNTNRQDKMFNDANSITALRSGGAFGSLGSTFNNRFSYNNSLTYADKIGKEHKFDVTLGQEYIYNYSESMGASATNFPNVNNGWFDLGQGTVAGFPSSFAEEDKLLSFFGRANYSYKNRYIFAATLRADGSSKFGEDNRWGYFPSASMAWRIIDEPFMKSLNFLSDLKLRASYGTSGNNRIANYAALGTFTSGQYASNNTLVPTVFQNTLANPQLKWEALKAANIGLDMGFLKQRIVLSIELFENRSKDLLYNSRIPASAGFVRQFRNIGATSSKGIEFSLNTVNVKTADFSWNTNFNIAFNKTKVLSLSEGENFLLTSSYNPNFQDYILQVGQPVGAMYGYVQDGLYQVSDFDYNAASSTYTLKSGIVTDNITVQPGFIKFKDLNGDGKITDADRTVIGNATPKYTGGINNTFAYKGFDLSIFLNFTGGNDIFNANVKNNLSIAGDFTNNMAFQADRWRNVNAAGEVVKDPAQLAELNQGKNKVASILGNTSGRMYDTLVEDGSFLRISNVSLGYTLPKKWLEGIKIANARIYVTAYNLHVFTNYSGYDPEVSVINNPLTSGVDFSAYPRPRSFVAGINLSL